MVPEKLCVFLSIGFFSTSSSCISLTEDVASQVIPKACYVQRKINGHGSLWQQVRWISDCTSIFKTEEVENPCHWSERVSSEFLEYVLDCFFFFLKHSWVLLRVKKRIKCTSELPQLEPHITSYFCFEKLQFLKCFPKTQFEPHTSKYCRLLPSQPPSIIPFYDLS